MTMSLILIAGILSLLLLSLTCLSILFSLQIQNHHQINSPPSSTVPNTKHILRSYLTHSHLSSFWKLLRRHALFPDYSIVKIPTTAPGVRMYDYDGGEADEEEECSVCLCRILQGDEVRELRCHHLFHSPCLDSWVGTGRVTWPFAGAGSPPRLRCHHLFHSPCLDSWVGTGRVTCPLCRGGVASPAATDDGGAEVLFFKQFCSLRDHRQDKWWLR